MNINARYLKIVKLANQSVHRMSEKSYHTSFMRFVVQMRYRKLGIAREDNIGQTRGDQAQILRAKYPRLVGRVDINIGWTTALHVLPWMEGKQFLVLIVAELRQRSGPAGHCLIQAFVYSFSGGAPALGDMPK